MKKPSVPERIEALKARAEELRRAEQAESARRRKVEESLERNCQALQDALAVLHGIPVGKDTLVGTDRVPHSCWGRSTVRVLHARAADADPKSTLTSFLVTVDPATMKAWTSYGSQTVTADEAVEIALTEAERKVQ